MKKKDAVLNLVQIIIAFYILMTLSLGLLAVNDLPIQYLLILIGLSLILVFGIITAHRSRYRKKVRLRGGFPWQ